MQQMRHSATDTPPRDSPGIDTSAASQNGRTGFNVHPGQRHGHEDSEMRDGHDHGSIVLVGRRGSGLSSFAVMASRLLNYPILDVEANMKHKYGMGRAACIKSWGVRRFRDVATAELEDALQQHCQRHILLCGPEGTILRLRHSEGHQQAFHSLFPKATAYDESAYFDDWDICPHGNLSEEEDSEAEGDEEEDDDKGDEEDTEEGEGEEGDGEEDGGTDEEHL